MTASVRILSTSSLDSTPCVVFVAPDGSKVLINCGEGCQRVFLEHSQRLASVSTVCLCHLGHEAIGGLPGMVLTSADVTAVSKASAAALASTVAIAKIQHNVEGSQSRNNSKKENASKHPKEMKHTLNLRCENRLELPNLNIIGPVGTKLFLHSLRHFMRRDQFRIDPVADSRLSINCSNGSIIVFSVDHISPPSFVLSLTRVPEVVSFGA